MKTGKVKGFVCGILVAGILLSGFNIYATEKKQKENENIKGAMKYIELMQESNIATKATTYSTKSTAYSNLAIYEELKEMNSKLDKLLK